MVYMTLFYTVSEIFNVERPPLKSGLGVGPNSRSLQMAPFNRSSMSSYWRSMATMALGYLLSFPR